MTEPGGLLQSRPGPAHLFDQVLIIEGGIPSHTGGVFAEFAAGVNANRKSQS